MSNPAKSFSSEWKGASGRERAYMVGGGISLVLAIIGVFLPIVPQVPFAILAAFLFAEGSPKLHRWIRQNKYLGQPVRDWEDKRVVRPKLKLISCVMMAGGAALGHFKLPLGWALALDGAFFLAILFVSTRRSR